MRRGYIGEAGAEERGKEGVGERNVHVCMRVRSATKGGLTMSYTEDCLHRITILESYHTPTM